MNGWTLLMLGILFEVSGTYCLKLSDGFSNVLASIGCFAFFAIAIALITLSAKTLDVSIVYAIWSGVGVVLVTVIGALFFAEQVTLPKLFFISLILVGVLGLHYVSSDQPKGGEQHVDSTQ